MSNKYFNTIFKGKASGLENFEIVQPARQVINKGYKRTDGEAISGQIYEIILKRK